ncbi:MAG: PD40 domain-containing protein [Kiritimatiellae bacterium]|nr:PD40 domain-containing protein [Kiritimatiellia bacterium]
MKRLDSTIMLAMLMAAGCATASVPPAGEGVARDGGYTAIPPDAKDDWGRIYLGSNPSVEPHGNFFIFEWNDMVWGALTSGGEARPVISNTDASWPAISADGSKIAFGSRREDNYNVYVLNLDTHQCRKVGHHSEVTVPRQWSRDGKKIVCTAVRDNDGDLYCQRIVLLDAEGGEVEEMPFDAVGDDPNLSPDGKKLLFTWHGDEIYRKRTHSFSAAAGEIWMYDLETKDFTCIVKTPYGARNPVWTGDGGGFYYLSAEKGFPFRNVFFHDFADGTDTRLTAFNDEHCFQPSVSADGSTLMFRAGFDFWRLDLKIAGAVPVRVPLFPAIRTLAQNPVKRRHYEMVWNNDETGDVCFTDNGMQVAFTAGGDLWVMETDLHEPKLVKGSSLTHERECFFSPDGKDLYYLSDRGDGVDLCVARRADETKAWWENDDFVHTRLTNDDLVRRGLTVSPDGRFLAWMNDLGKLSFADRQGNVFAQGPDASGAGFYSWAPDGNWVTVTLGDIYGNYDVWIVPVTDPDAEAYNLSRNFKRDDWPVWSPDGKIIVFVGERAADNNATSLFYVYLNPADEAADLKKAEKNARAKVQDYSVSPAEEVADENLPAVDETGGADAQANERNVKIVFDDLHKRVRRINVRAEAPFFRWDSRTVAYDAGNGETHSIEIPSRPSPNRIFKKVGRNASWLSRDSRVTWIVDNLPAHGEVTIPVHVYQETDVADYRELGFRMAWARIKNRFYDKDLHGADWNAVKEKLLPAARNATSMSVYYRVMRWMLGELDASHLGFYASDQSLREWEKRAPMHSWKEQTAHLGLILKFATEGDWWEVQEVLPDGPAALTLCGIAPGDRIHAIDGKPITRNMDPTELLNGNANRTVRFTWSPKGRDSVRRETRVQSQNFSAARRQKRNADLAAARRKVHELSGGRVGYIDVPQMDWATFYAFQDDLFAEAYGKEAIIIDVRSNTGGFTADRILDLLCTPSHSTFSSRGFAHHAYLMSYWGKPVFSGKVALLSNCQTFSNGEIFSHAIRNTHRGILIGQPTNGGVIATSDRALLDLGMFRDAFRGCYDAFGNDMENNPAVPDIFVPDIPSDKANDIDPFLPVAVEALLAAEDAPAET